MDAQKIQFGGDFLGHEAGSQARAVEAPRHQSHGDQVAVIVLANGRRKLMAPLPGNGRPRAVLLLQGDELHEVTFSPPNGGPSQSPGLRVAARNDWLVHQVVAEHGGALGQRPATASQNRAWAFQRPSSESRSYQAGTSCLR